jgi:hypothetical protein
MNYIALLTAISLVIGLVGTIISKNLIYYLLSPIITRAIWAAIFLVSLLFSKSLFQVIVESIVAFPEILKTKKTYRKAWIILTMIWGIYQLLLAILFLILIHTVSVSVYVTLTMISSVCDIGLTMFSFWFGRWYLGRTRVANSDN